MKTRILSIFMALTIVLSLLPTAAMAAGDRKGSENNPYSREEFEKMTRDEYISAQKALGGTMYVDIGSYNYAVDGVLGNGTASNSDTDSTKLNYYGAPGAKSGQYSDDAVGKSIVFVGDSITSGVTGYTNIDRIGTSLLLAVPAYTDVTFKGITFNNVMRFNYQLYTSPWSQLGELKFDGCTFNGIIAGATAAQTLTFNGCEFTNFTNTTDPNNSNPIWIRPAYGNWNSGDNEGQGDDFRSLTKINFINNRVTSTRPVKFEYISQWDITSTVTATDNHFDISAQNGDTSIKNVGLYLGAHGNDNEFNLIAEKNSKSEATAALYTIPAGEKSLPAGSTVKDSQGNEITITDALEWKTDNKVELKTEYQDSAVAGINGVGYDTLDDAITAAKDGDTITILKAAEDENGYKLNSALTYSGKAITIRAASGVDVKFDMSTAVALHGAKITFEDVTFAYHTNGNYIGLQHTDTMVYNNCVFNGQVFLYGASEIFNGCIFNQDSEQAYNVWTYGAKEVEFNNCTFECAGKSVLVYNEGSDSGIDLTVTDTTFHASQPVEGKAAIEIDTSLMKGQTKITVDQATADKVTGFGIGSNSGSSLWNDKKQTAETNKNTTVVVAGKTVFEPTCVDLDTFIKMVESADYNFNGIRDDGSKLTVKWSPESGCFDPDAPYHKLGDDCPKTKATGNTPNRLQNPYGQYQLFTHAVNLSISNVRFVYTPAEVSVCGNTPWGGKKTPTLAELQLRNSGNTTFTGCSFDKVTVSPYGKGNDQGNTNEQNITSFTDCGFSNITDKYAIKDVYAGNVTVENCTFTECGGGIYLEGNAQKGIIDISGNKFEHIGSKGLIQFSANGDYTKAQITLDCNTATNCGPILRQLNQGIADKDVLKNNLKGDLTGLGGTLTYTVDSIVKEGEDTPAQPTVYTVRFEGADVAERKVVNGTEIALPAPANRPDCTFEGWYVNGVKADNSYVVTGDVTFVAKWNYTDDDPTYSVTLPKVTGGSIKVSPRSAEKGETVTITVAPDKGYELDKLVVTGRKGSELDLTEKDGNRFTFKMPAGSVEIEVSFKLTGTEPEAPGFVDVPASAYYAAAVEWAVEQGITSGTSATTFSPDMSCTRAQMVTFLWRANGAPAVDGTMSFTDVPADAYYADAVRWAVSEGITTGTSATTFSPDATVTRAQAVTFIYRNVQAQGGGFTGSWMFPCPFTDVPADAYYFESVQWCAMQNITTGTSATTFSPDAPCTRAQIVTFLHRDAQ